MTFARILLKLWKLRVWVGIGAVLAVVAAVGSVATSKTTVYANATTQMLVDSPSSALANSGIDLSGYSARANVFARLMTSDQALQYMGKAAGIPGNLIDATGPLENNGSPIATHAPVAIKGNQNLPFPAIYKLSLVQNPDLPTVDVYAQAPTTAKAIALANGAVTGFANFVNQLEANNVPLSKRVQVRQLGPATGGMVDAGASKKIAVLAFFGVLGMWCVAVLFVSRLIGELRVAKHSGTDDLFTASAREFTGMPEREFSGMHEQEFDGVDAATAGSGLEHELQKARSGGRNHAGKQSRGDYPNQRISDPGESLFPDDLDKNVREEVGLRS